MIVFDWASNEDKKFDYIYHNIALGLANRSHNANQ